MKDVMLQKVDGNLRVNNPAKQFQEAWDSPNLNELQMQAVETFEDGQSLLALKGPPGTGKSHTLAILTARQAYALRETDSKRKMLILTPTNSVAEDTVRTLTKQLDPKGRQIRVVWANASSYSAQVTDDMRPFTLKQLAVHPQEGYELSLIHI